jgi:hypothetical protein
VAVPARQERQILEPRQIRRMIMGVLTGDMTRLCSEIGLSHGARQAFIEEMEERTSKMLAGFRDDHADMARKGKADREAFTSGLKKNVAAMQAGFRDAHAEAARRVRAALADFVSGLKTTVAALRGEFAFDLAGAHRAWFGPSPAGRMFVEGTERGEKGEAQRPAEAGDEKKSSSPSRAGKTRRGKGR